MHTSESYVDCVAAATKAVKANEMTACLDALEKAYTEGRSVFVAGNGGSAANASHLAQDLSKATVQDIDAGKRFRVLSLTDNIGFITALANDISYERVFDIQLRQFAKPGDVLLLISGSGNSPNILRAARCAKETDLQIIGVTGFDGGGLMPLSDVKLHVPINNMGMCEAAHAILFHYIVEELRGRFAAHRSRP